MDEKDAPGISGDIVFEERVSNFSLATITLDNTPAGGSHPAHIHENDAATTGGILFTFTAVDGTTGMSKTNVETSDGGSDITYADILTYNGFVNVHLADTALATIIAQENIGANAL